MGIAQRFAEVDPGSLVAVDFGFRSDESPVERLADREGLDDRAGLDAVFGDAGASGGIGVGRAVVRVEGRALGHGQHIAGLRVDDRGIERRRLPLREGGVELFLEDGLDRFADGQIEIPPVPRLLRHMGAVEQRAADPAALVDFAPELRGHLLVEIFLEPDLGDVAVVDHVREA